MFDATERRAYEQELLAARRRAEESEARATALARTLQATLPPAGDRQPCPGSTSAAPTARPATAARSAATSTTCSRPGRGTWAVVLGDVCGKGVAAAVVTALARYTVRAEALRTPYPSAVLAGLHDALVRHHPEQFCTAVFVALDRTTGRRPAHGRVGRPPPAAAPAGRRRRWTPSARRAPSSACSTRPALTDATTILHPGDVVVLYTDGVTEARRDGEFFDDERLLDAVAGAARRRRPADRRRPRRRGARVPAGRRPGRHRRRRHQGPLNSPAAPSTIHGMGHCLSRQSE